MASIGNNVSSPELGQRNLSQQFVSTGKVTEIVAVKDPFGSQSAISHPSFNHSVHSTSLQHGISAMPVSDKPATARVSSFLTSRHRSQPPLMVHVRKYHPKNDAPKVPFFDHTTEALNTHTAHNLLIPRENPRLVFGASAEVNNATATTDEASLLNNNAFTVQHEDGFADNAKDNQISHSILSTGIDDHLGEVYDSTPEFRGPTKENFIQINRLMPKLQRPDYYTDPHIQTLVSAENIEPGFCSHVKDFVVGRHGYGWVKFDGETDVRWLDLDAHVHFNNREVIVYMDDSKKPPVGKGLNKAAQVTLLNIKCIDKKMVDKFIVKLKRVCQAQGVDFVSYDPVKEEWKFRVKHFSANGLSDQDWAENYFTE